MTILHLKTQLNHLLKSIHLNRKSNQLLIVSNESEK